MAAYTLDVGRHELRLGDVIDDTPPATEPPALADTGWDLPHRPLTARQIIDELDSLFEAVCQQLGEAADRPVLLQSMVSTLKIAGREAVLPLQALAFADPLRRELTEQAGRIGETLAAWAIDANDRRTALNRHGADALGRLELRSRCDGHLWTAEAGNLLTGPAGGPVVMQLYNEWLHQLVLLRDALLPFENWAELPIPAHRQDGFRGLRALEAPRSIFLAEFLTRQSTHASIVRLARSLFDPLSASERETDYYGFQTERGLVLPSVIGREDIAAGPRGLLSWHPARIVAAPSGGTVVFRYALADYLAAPRSTVDPAIVADPPGGDAVVAAERIDDTSLVLWLTLEAGNRAYRVDLGQSLRGQRFAYRPAAGAPSMPGAVVQHRVEAVLSRPGLVTAADGIHLLPTGGNAVLTLALLGKIYPENTVLGEAAPWSAVWSAGKGYGAKFILGTPQAG